MTFGQYFDMLRGLQFIHNEKVKQELIITDERSLKNVFRNGIEIEESEKFSVKYDNNNKKQLKFLKYQIEMGE